MILRAGTVGGLFIVLVTARSIYFDVVCRVDKRSAVHHAFGEVDFARYVIG